MKIETTVFEVASRWLGVHERGGAADHPFIRWCHSLTVGGEAPDEVPWCSSFAQAPAFVLGLERSHSKAARSWLAVGVPVPPEQWQRGDVVIFKRGAGPQPGPEVLAAPGHVGFVDYVRNGLVMTLGGNQGDEVSIAPQPLANVLGFRRLRRLDQVKTA